jgi:hypothetical protein
MTQIRTPDQRLRIFVSSTMNELADERVATKRAIERLHLTPVMFELGARPYPPRDLYLAYLQQSDVFIGIYAQQYGWVAPGSTVSGLEDEFLAASDKPRLVYIRSPAPERDPRLSDMLHRMQSTGLSYHTFKTPRDLARLVSDDLAILVSDHFAAVQYQAPPARPPPASPPVGGDEPRSANRFIGRRQELATLARLLTNQRTRLVTLVGPGGIGKTRLALQSVATVGPRYDAIAVASLDHVSPAQPLIDAAIASSLGMSEATGAPLLDSIAQNIGDRRVFAGTRRFRAPHRLSTVRRRTDRPDSPVDRTGDKPGEPAPNRRAGLRRARARSAVLVGRRRGGPPVRLRAAVRRSRHRGRNRAAAR